MSNLDLIDEFNSTGVHTPSTLLTLDPRQERFRSLYFDVESKTFGNCYQSAIGAGFTDKTARNMTSNKPSWYLELLGQMQPMESAHLLLKLQEIINDPDEPTQNRLKAIDMIMRHKGMFKSDISVQFNHLTIESVL